MRRLPRLYKTKRKLFFAVACLLTAFVLLYSLHVRWDHSVNCEQKQSVTATIRPERWKLGQTIALRHVPVQSATAPLLPETVAIGPTRFPKLIHQTVKSKAQLSCQQRKVIASWRALNPGYSHRLWDDADIQRFMQQFYPELVPSPFNDFVSGAERSDLWRVLVLHKMGGVYADMDVQCLKPIDEWNADHDHDAAVLLGVENYDAGRRHPLHVVNWVLAAAPGHPLLGSMPGVVLRAVQRQFFELARTAGAVLHGSAYTNGIIDR
eukprot:GHRQ01012429.1.p1 GENE.GHRQ01012429.1~~GHRQ01012429.1.p1  ORF type:complete len:265 (+),score=28.99 GHRQ01012429.1:96-890(+)